MPTETESISYGGKIYHRTTITGNGSVIENDLSGPVERHVFTKSRNYVKRMKPLTPFIKPTAYELTVTKRECGIGTLKCGSIGAVGGTAAYRVTETGPVGSLMIASDSLYPLWAASSSQRNRVIIDALLKLKDQRVNLAQAFAERRMTANLVADSLNRIAGSVMALRKGNWRRAGKLLKQSWRKAPRSWLEYQYGWNPLMDDVFGSVEALKKRNSPGDWLVTVKDSAMDVEQWEQFFQNSTTSTKRPFWYKNRRSRGHFIRLDYEPGNTFLTTVSGLGLTNPLQLAWELVPYSFVIDWFTPIGDWLSSLDASLGFKFYSGSITAREESYETTDNLQCLSGEHNGWWYNNTRVETSKRSLHLKREVFSASPLPGFPGFKDPFSASHVANGLSLLTQALAPGPVRIR